MPDAPMLSVIVPAYNEAERIGPTLRSIGASMAGYPANEIIVVDDGSSDATRAVVRTLASEIASLSMIESSPNRGKGHAVRLGMLAARGARRLFMDADNATTIDELPRLLDALDRGADVAIGSRRAPGARQLVTQPWHRRAWSRATNRVVQAGLLRGIRDTQCGFKLFGAAAATEIFSRARIAGWGFDLEVLVLARALGFTIAECGVTWRDDRRTRISPLRDAVAISREFLAIRRALHRGEYDLSR